MASKKSQESGTGKSSASSSNKSSTGKSSFSQNPSTSSSIKSSTGKSSFSSSWNPESSTSSQSFFPESGSVSRLSLSGTTSQTSANSKSHQPGSSKGSTSKHVDVGVINRNPYAKQNVIEREKAPVASPGAEAGWLGIFGGNNEKKADLADEHPNRMWAQLNGKPAGPKKTWAELEAMGLVGRKVVVQNQFIEQPANYGNRAGFGNQPANGNRAGLGNQPANGNRAGFGNQPANNGNRAGFGKQPEGNFRRNYQCGTSSNQNGVTKGMHVLTEAQKTQLPGISRFKFADKYPTSLPKQDAKKVAKENPEVFFDITIGGHPSGRIVMELFSHIVPKTAENFRSLCIGAMVGKSGNLLHYKGSSFHRVIPGFTCQGGVINGNGRESIYGEKFKDENFKMKHTGEGILTMANVGPGTNGSEFYICTTKTESLDGKNVVFGQVLKGMDVVEAIDKVGLPSGDCSKPVVVADCGQVSLFRWKNSSRD